VREFFEKNYSDEEVRTNRGTFKLAISALLEVAQSVHSHLELAIMEIDSPMRMMESKLIAEFVNIIEKDKVQELERNARKMNKLYNGS